MAWRETTTSTTHTRGHLSTSPPILAMCVCVCVCVYSPIYAGTFMVAPQDEEVLWVLDLVSEQQTNGLQGLLPSVDIIAQKDKSCFSSDGIGD